jgi:hypothetical protein
VNVPEVSGRAFLGIIRSVKQRHGQAGLTRTLAKTTAETQASFAKRLLHANWYPYSSFIDFLQCLEREFSHGDPLFGRKLGEASGQQDLSTVLRVYVALASSERLIRSCSKVWASYYRNAGSMDALSWAPENTTLVIRDFPTMAPIHCRLMEGWMIGTMAVLGLQVSDDGHESKCTSRGDAVHEFTCSWRAK